MKANHGITLINENLKNSIVFPKALKIQLDSYPLIPTGKIENNERKKILIEMSMIYDSDQVFKKE